MFCVYIRHILKRHFLELLYYYYVRCCVLCVCVGYSLVHERMTRCAVTKPRAVSTTRKNFLVHCWDFFPLHYYRCLGTCCPVCLHGDVGLDLFTRATPPPPCVAVAAAAAAAAWSMTRQFLLRWNQEGGVEGKTALATRNMCPASVLRCLEFVLRYEVRSNGRSGLGDSFSSPCSV